ncbi:MAG TPA: CBS domain-containing protein [Actinomycetes bacterium]|nr:CBS domain-containing protein [Actinomycetes bacterium]
MGQRIDEIMTKNVVTVPINGTVLEAARLMQENAIGDVVAVDGEQLWGLITDRDIVTRVVAEGRPPQETSVAEVSSRNPVTVQPGQDFREAVLLMRSNDIRRLPVVDDGRLVGIVTLGDLAEHKDPNSALGDISAAPPQQ